MVLSTVMDTVIPSVSPPVLSPSIVKGTFGDSVTLPCDGPPYVQSPEDQLDVLWQTDGGKKVARFSRGVHSVGFHFTKRVTFLTEDIRRGDFSITISSIAFSDEGAYECVWKSQKHSEKVLDVKLDIMEPPFMQKLSVPAGESVTFQCYVHVNKQASDRLVVQWKRGDELVLKLISEKVTYGRMYAERATVSPDRIQKGDFSLFLNVTGLCDSGAYQCSTDEGQNGTPVVLEIKEYGQFDAVNISLGMAFPLSLPGEPVKV
ncbi:hypothetical protein SKAU_G00429970 [Synaphobranchus kaupii]|uniref:Ig-like domain-containing protein n=1 Tax=Synaphobranchus kaupii TaxID=118154 RepID=A0A9Q1E4S5_SYNKA|nr:hypothetical protein SKAU_G00429970 [Synaphobranchus kaupii]